MNFKGYGSAVLVGVLCMGLTSSFQAQAGFARSMRDFCLKYRYAFLGVSASFITYMYSRKFISTLIEEYQKRKQTAAQVQPNDKPVVAQPKCDYFEASADILIKSTKLIGTLFKIVRALTCPDAGKAACDQWLDDFSSLA